MLIIFNIVLLSLVTSCTCLVNYNATDKEYAAMPALFHLDNYDQCMLLGEEALFCKFTFELQSDSGNDNPVWNTISRVSSDPRNYRHDQLRHGICVPTTCPNATNTLDEISEEIEVCYNKKYQHLELKGNITKITCETATTDYPVDLLDIIVVGLFIVYAILIIFSSIYEGSARYKKRDTYDKITGTKFGKLIAAFSIPKNWQRLKSTNTNSDARKLRCIQGIRAYNMMCVILCHSLMISFAGPVSNTKYIENMTRKVLNMFIANGCYVVQSFFVISGWLLSFHFFQMLEGKKNVNLVKYVILAFINRYIRLTPILMVMIAFESTWLVHMGQGPQWKDCVVKEYESCRKNWWTNLLYINNYVNKKEMCLHQTWYIAADTQLFLLSLIVMAIAWKNPSKVKIILGIGIIAGLIVQGSIAFIHNYDIIIRQYPDQVLYDLKGLQRDDWHDLYSSGYSNITGYMIGLLFGYLFYKYRNKDLTIKRIHVVIWWILSFGLCVFIILIAAKMYSPNYKNTRFKSALYWAFGKNVFALGIAIGIFGITQKIGWFVRWFCEWNSIQVFGRLTYSTYIIHTVLIRIRAGYLRSPLFINDYLLLTTILGDIVLSYLAGTLLCMCFEMPISALQKLMIPHLESKKLEGSSDKSLKTLNYDECDFKNKQSLSTKV